MVFYGVDKAQNCIHMPPGALLQLLSPLGGGSVVVCPICSVCLWGFCVFVLNIVLSIFSSFAVIWMRKRDLALYLYCARAVLWLSDYCVCSL